MSSEQNSNEMAWLLKQVAGSKSILEIGSRTGALLYGMASVCPVGARICSIDLGYDIEGQRPGPYSDFLQETMAEIRGKGYAAEALIANSRDKFSIAWAMGRAPFDFIFIDGDHSYDGVKADWENYGSMSKRVAFHDIINPVLGVGRLWAEIKLGRVTVEEIAPNSPMGIGLVIQ